MPSNNFISPLALLWHWHEKTTLGKWLHYILAGIEEDHSGIRWADRIFFIYAWITGVSMILTSCIYAPWTAKLGFCFFLFGVYRTMFIHWIWFEGDTSPFHKK